MKSMEVGHEQGYAAVLLTGASSVIESVAKTLSVIGERVVETSDSTILLQDVRSSHLPNIETVVAENNMTLATHGERKFLVQVPKVVKKAFKLNLKHGKWYFADNIEEDFPFVLIRDSRIEDLNDGRSHHGDIDQVQMLDLEFHSTDGEMPIREIMSSVEAARFGLRPATEDDFEDHDMIPPAPESLVFVEASVPGGPDKEALHNFSR